MRRRYKPYFVKMLRTEQKNVPLRCRIGSFVYEIIRNSFLKNQQLPLVMPMRRIGGKVFARDLFVPDGKQLDDIILHRFIVKLLLQSVNRIIKNKVVYQPNDRQKTR